jgi:hypothetical protein
MIRVDPRGFRMRPVVYLASVFDEITYEVYRCGKGIDTRKTRG